MKKLITDVKNIRPGMQIQVFCGINNPNNCLIHVRQIVDEEICVFRTYSQKKGWIYHTQDLLFYRLIIDKFGTLTQTGWDEDLKPTNLSSQNLLTKLQQCAIIP